jgi:hypothetical protein
MAFEQKDNSGAIFKNNKKQNENSPPLTGNALIGGVEYWVSAWSKTDKNGEKWISFSVKQKNPTSDQRQATKAVDLDEDSIPF